MTRNIHLLVIDPQNDFCDIPGAALPVAGAHQDMQQLATWLRAQGEQIDAITITLDSHHQFDIAHPLFWQTGTGADVAPFTAITGAQVQAGEFRPRRPEHLARALAYLDELERNGRYTLMVWPVHCEIGTWGHNVHADLHAAYAEWERRGGRTVAKVTKGSNPWTEHYSALQAEVPDAADAHTQLNQALIQDLDRADLIVIAGEASSHCVKATTEHLAAHLDAKKLVLLTDCMSPVGGFEAQAAAFLADMQTRGARLTTAEQAL